MLRPIRQVTSLHTRTYAQIRKPWMSSSDGFMNILRTIHYGHSIEEPYHHFAGIKTHNEIYSEYTFPKSYIVAHRAIKQRLAITPIKYVLCYAYYRIASLVATVVIAWILFDDWFKIFESARKERGTYVSALSATMLGIFLWLFPNIIVVPMTGLILGLLWPAYVPCMILDAIKN